MCCSFTENAAVIVYGHFQNVIIFTALCESRMIMDVHAHFYMHFTSKIKANLTLTTHQNHGWGKLTTKKLPNIVKENEAASRVAD